MIYEREVLIDQCMQRWFTQRALALAPLALYLSWRDKAEKVLEDACVIRRTVVVWQ